LTGKAFERAANAFEALVRNGDPESPDRGFRRTIAAAAYHLAGFSAVAYSLFNETAGDLNASPGETAIQHLILRDLGGLRGYVREWLDDEAHGDEQIAAALAGGRRPTPPRYGHASEPRLLAAAFRNGRSNTISACSTSPPPRLPASIGSLPTRVMGAPG
jgi:hypothetical protein